MSAPLVWVITPAVIGALLFFLRRWQNVNIYVGVAVSLWLAWIAWILPFGEPIALGSLSLKISESYTLLGRELILSEAERPFIAFLYLVSALWLLGAFFARPTNLFVPFAMVTVALLNAALSVEPFLYAALIIETIALLAVPLLAAPGQRSRRGTLRFLAFQTFGMPFILFTGWMLAGVEATPGNIGLVVRAGVLMAIGFAFLLAIFPFHSWIPMVAEESHPYVAAFLFFMLPSVVSLFGLGFIDRFAWLRESDALLNLVRVLGVVMVAVGGLWTAFEEHLGRMLGYAAVMEIGWSLLAIGLGGPDGVLIYFWLMVPRAVSLVVWAISLSRLYREAGGNVRLSAMTGFGWRFPLSGLGLLLAHFSLAGLPLLAGFPVRFVLWEKLALDYPVVAAISVLGAIAFLFGGLRTLLALFVTEEQGEDQLEEPVLQVADELSEQEKRIRLVLSWSLFAAFGAVFLLVGLFPQRYLAFLELLVGMFPQLGG